MLCSCLNDNCLEATRWARQINPPSGCGDTVWRREKFAVEHHEHEVTPRGAEADTLHRRSENRFGFRCHAHSYAAFRQKTVFCWCMLECARFVLQKYLRGWLNAWLYKCVCALANDLLLTLLLLPIKHLQMHIDDTARYTQTPTWRNAPMRSTLAACRTFLCRPRPEVWGCRTHCPPS